ncbi:MAG: biopolymer transporter ExbD [Chlamydiales bacterium]|nr:biopolymer transporter ExbD [Chlamydiales bacterium]
MKHRNQGLDDDDLSSLVNLTPLLDVLFVILILFIFITPFIELDKISLAPSEIPSEQKQQISYMEKDPIIITVLQDNRIMINHQFISIDQLQPLLLKLYKEFPQSCPKLYHDQHAYFGTYQAVKTSLEIAGFKEMDVILQSK